MQHNIRSGLSCLHEQGISYIVLYGGYAAPNRLEETVRWLALNAAGHTSRTGSKRL